MNAGCYGCQTADNLKRILIMNYLGEIKYINLEDLNLKYRSSNIATETIILNAEFNFEYGSKNNIQEKIDNYLLKYYLHIKLKIN